MAGLLDFVKTPEGQGLLSAAFGGLAGARRGAPINSVGRAGLAGLAGYGGALDRQTQQDQLARQNQLFDVQLGNAKRQAEVATGIQQAGRDSIRNPAHMAMANGQGPTLANAAAIETTQPGFDTQGFLSRVMAIDPLKGLELRASMAKETPFGKVDPKDYTQESIAKFAQSGNFGDLAPARKREVGPAGQVFDPYSIQPGQVLADPNKPFAIGQDGVAVANAPYQQYQITKASAGAAKNSVILPKIELKTGESLAGQVGPIMKDSGAAAEGAVRQVDAAQRIIKAIDSNQVMSGPGANARVRVAQVSQLLGVGGKDEAEMLANTRAAIRGLAELTLQGRQQMRGQGQITDKESALAEKAMSGDIADLTPAEIKQLAQASERTARHVYGQHQRKLQVMQQNPNLQDMAAFYAAPEIPASAPNKTIDALPTANSSNKGQRIRDTTTGKIFVSNGMQWKPE